jgi:hypothetical protein
MAGGLFDDLPTIAPPGGVPGGVPGAAPGAPGGLFADIGADPLAGMDLSVPDPKAAKAIIDKLPEESRQRARDMWADSVVERQRAGGGVMQRVDDGVRRVVGAVPGLGTWADEIAATANKLISGEDYDMGVALERARTRAIDKTPTTTLATLPLVGPITTGGLETAAGTIGGALALPFARVMQGSGAVATGVNVGANAAAAGFVQGAGEAEGGVMDRLAKGTADGGAAAAGGLLLGGAIGKLASKGTPASVQNQLDSNAAAEAAKLAGVDLPRVAAGTKNGAEMIVGATIKELPLAGRPISKAVDQARDQIEEAGERIASKYSPNATPESAGEMARYGISQWIKRESGKDLETLYQGVNQYLPKNASAKLTNTQAAADRLLALDAEAATDINARAVKFVEGALSRPNGLSYDGMRMLRTRIGDLIDDHLTPDGGTIKPALKELYGALTEDIKGGLKAMGGRAGNDALKAWQLANTAARITEVKRQALSKIVGLDGNAPAEQVVDRLVRMAGSKSSADAKNLIRARQVLPATAWEEVSAAAIGRLGRDQSNQFNPNYFLKNYEALSVNGRKTLFGIKGTAGTKTLRDELDALALTARSYKNLDVLKNTSGTGRVVFGTMAMFGTVNPAALPLIALKGLGARVVAEALAKPVTVKAINRQAVALHNFLESGGGQQLLKLTTLTMAKQIADATGADEKEVTNTVKANLGTILQSAPRGPELGTGSARK